MFAIHNAIIRYAGIIGQRIQQPASRGTVRMLMAHVGVVGGIFAPDTTPAPRAISPQLASITTDTGAFASGPHDYGKYTPDLCRSAIRSAEYRARRSLMLTQVLDTLHSTARDTTGAGVGATIARSCAMRFVNAATTVQERFALLDLALAAQQDSLVRAVITQRLAATSTPSVGDALTLNAMDLYLTVLPTRLAGAEWLAARLDSLGTAHQIPRIRAHLKLMRVRALGRESDDELREALTLLDLGREASDSDFYRLEPTRAQLYGLNAKTGLLQRVWMYVLGEYQLRRPADIHTLLERYQREYLWRQINRPENRTLIASPRGCTKPSNESAQQWDCYPVSDSTLSDSLLQIRIGTNFSLPSASDPPFVPVADYWFPIQKGTPLAFTPGKISLLINEIGAALYDGEYRVLLGSGSPILGYVRRLIARYGTALDVTVIVQAHGHTIADGAATPTQEAERARWFFQDLNKIPVNVAVQVTQYTHRPTPDNRKVQADTTQIEKLWGEGNSENGKIVVVGRDGHMLATGQWDQCTDLGNWEGPSLLQFPDCAEERINVVLRQQRLGQQGVGQKSVSVPPVPPGSFTPATVPSPPEHR